MTARVGKSVAGVSTGGIVIPLTKGLLNSPTTILAGVAAVIIDPNDVYKPGDVNLTIPQGDLVLSKGGLALVATDTVGAESGTASGVITKTCTCTVGSGQNKFLLAALTIDDASSAVTVTWDVAGANQPMTLLGSINTTTFNRVYLYGLLSPTAGAGKLVTANWTGSSTGAGIGAISFTGVDQSSLGNAATITTGTGSGTSNAISVTSDVGDYIVMGWGFGGNIPSAAGPTQWYVDTNPPTWNFAGCRSAGASPSVSMTFTDSTSGPWAGIAANVNHVVLDTQPIVGNGTYIVVPQGDLVVLDLAGVTAPTVTVSSGGDVAITVPQGNLADSSIAPIVGWTTNYGGSILPTDLFSFNKNNLAVTAGTDFPPSESVSYNLTEDGSSNLHSAYAKNFYRPAGAWSVSAELKANGRTWAWLATDFFGGVAIFVDLTNKVFGSSGPQHYTSGSVVDLGSGWCKVTLNFESTADAGETLQIGSTTGDFVLSYSGDGSSGIIVGKVAFIPAILHADLVDSSVAPTITRTANSAITVPQGNLAESSAAPTVAAGGSVSLIPPQGNLKADSIAPTIGRSANVNIIPLQGNVAESSVGPVLGFGFTPAQGNLVESSVGPKLDLGIKPPQGNLAESSVGPKLDFGINPPQGNLAETSVAPVVRPSIMPSQGNLAFSRSQPDVQAGAEVSRTVPQGNLAESSLAPTVALTANVSIVPLQGNIALSGTAPPVSVGIGCAPGRRDVVISGTAPTITLSDNHALVPLQGNVVLSEVASTIAVATNRVPLQGNLALSFVAGTAVLSNNQFPAPLQGNAALSGTAPSVAQTLHRNIAPPQGNLGLTEEAPATGGTMSRLPPQGNMALSSVAPAVARTAHVWANPVTRDAVLTSVAPTVFASNHHPIVVPQGNALLSTLPAQLVPGVYIYPTYANLRLSFSSPSLVFGRLTHWRRPIILQGDIDYYRASSGSVDMKAALSGSVKQDQTLGAG